MGVPAEKEQAWGGRGWALAGAAGACAALAAVAAKFASPQVGWDRRLLCYAGVVALNAAMWSFYSSSITLLSSVQVTVVSFGANFLLSGVAGVLLFGEVARPQWFLGASLIVLGILALSKGNRDPGQKPDKVKPL